MCKKGLLSKNACKKTAIKIAILHTHITEYNKKKSLLAFLGGVQNSHLAITVVVSSKIPVWPEGTILDWKGFFLSLSSYLFIPLAAIKLQMIPPRLRSLFEKEDFLRNNRGESKVTATYFLHFWIELVTFMSNPATLYLSIYVRALPASLTFGIG